MFFYTVVVCRSPCDCIIFCFCAEQTLHGLIHCLKNLNVQTSQTCKMLKEVGVYFQNNQTGLVLKEETSICMCCVILVLTPEQCWYSARACVPSSCLGGVIGCLTKSREEMNPGISLESAPSGLNYSPGCFWPVINDLVTPPTPFFKHKPKYDTAQRLKKKDFFSVLRWASVAVIHLELWAQLLNYREWIPPPPRPLLPCYHCTLWTAWFTDD